MIHKIITRNFDVIGMTTAWLGITLAGVTALLQAVSLTVLIGYTLWKWRKEYKRANRYKKK